MNKKVLILALSAIIIFAAAFLYFNNPNRTVYTEKRMIDEDTQLRNNVVEIETNISLTHFMKMSFDELINKTEPYIHSYYKETYFDGLKKANETRNLVPYLSEPPYYRYISKAYSSNDNSVKQVFIKFPVDSAINFSDRTPVEGTKFQIAKAYTFKKENGEWKVFSIGNYILSIDRNEPKRIIERFTNFNGAPLEYENIKILE